MNGKTKEYKISRTGRRSLLFHGEEIADSVNGQIQGLVLGVTFFRTENGKIIVLFRSVVSDEETCLAEVFESLYKAAEFVEAFNPLSLPFDVISLATTSEDVTSTWNSLVNSVFEQLDLVETVD